MTFNLSVNEKSKDSFNRITAIAEIMGVSTSSLIMKGVKMYINKEDGITPLIIDESLWGGILSKTNKEDLKNMNTLLFRLNQKIMEFYDTNK